MSPASIALGLFAAIGLTSWPQASDAPGARERAAWSALEAASRRRASLAGLEGAARARARDALIEALHDVRARYGEIRTVAVQAALCAGELLRGWEEPARARAEFEWAREHAQAAPDRARAILELAHLERRQGRFEAALHGYVDVAAVTGLDAGTLDAARFWQGRVQRDLGRRSEARRTWSALAEAARSPLMRIDAYDELALECVERGDLEGAAGWLDRCRRALQPTAEEASELGASTRNALSRLRAPIALERAIRERVVRVRVAR